MDWITLSVEVIGFVILCVWTVLPAREFAAIFSRISLKRTSGMEASNPVPTPANRDSPP